MGTINECSEDQEPTCDSFIRENCKYLGTEKLKKNKITDAHACQDLLREVGFVYGAVYFEFDTNTKECVLFDSKDADCDAISGPRTPSMEECNSPTQPTTAGTTAGTTVPTAPTVPTTVPTTVKALH